MNLGTGQRAPLTPDMIKEDKIANTHYRIVSGAYSCREFRLSGKERSIHPRTYPGPKMLSYLTTKWKALSGDAPH